jgi:threonine/homoserine/homoserine lactone efflux protein
MLWAFIPVAVIVSLTPGATTAMVVRSALRGGPGSGVRTVAGNEIGVFAWALLSVLGITALVAASAVAFLALKVLGAGVLIWLGTQSLRRARAAGRRGADAPALPDPVARILPGVDAPTLPGPEARILPGVDAPALPDVLRLRPFRDGLITALANPKLAVFFVALFPQFLHRHQAVLPTTLLMATLIVVFDFIWYTAMSFAVSRAGRAIGQSRLMRRAEQVSGALLIGLGVRVALEQR